MRSTDDTTNSTRTFMKPPPEPKEKRSRNLPNLNLKQKKYLPWLIVAVLIVVSLFLFSQYHQVQSKLSTNSQEYYTQQTKRLGKLILLPADETPTIVGVKDASRLQSQAFYAQAKNGDVTFIYAKAKKAILYRPDTNMIINVAPVNTTPSN